MLAMDEIGNDNANGANVSADAANGNVKPDGNGDDNADSNECRCYGSLY